MKQLLIALLVTTSLMGYSQDYEYHEKLFDEYMLSFSYIQNRSIKGNKDYHLNWGSNLVDLKFRVGFDASQLFAFIGASVHMNQNKNIDAPQYWNTSAYDKGYELVGTNVEGKYLLGENTGFQSPLPSLYFGVGYTLIELEKLKIEPYMSLGNQYDNFDFVVYKYLKEDNAHDKIIRELDIETEGFFPTVSAGVNARVSLGKNVGIMLFATYQTMWVTHDYIYSNSDDYGGEELTSGERTINYDHFQLGASFFLSF